MASSGQTGLIRRVVATAMVLAMATGCAETSNWIKGRSGSVAANSDVVGDERLDAMIDELGQVASGDPALQAEIYADAAAAAQLTPDVDTQLRLGLVLAVPGHPEYDPQTAQSILREVLAQTVLLTAGEISLATLQLNNVERQIVADSESRRQQTSSARTAETRERTLLRQVEALQTENQQLQQNLDEAEEKLEAITTIERSIRDQE